MTFRVALGDRSYDVLTGAGVRRSLPTVISSLAPRASSVAIITDSGGAVEEAATLGIP